MRFTCERFHAKEYYKDKVSLCAKKNIEEFSEKKFKHPNHAMMHSEKLRLTITYLPRSARKPLRCY